MCFTAIKPIILSHLTVLLMSMDCSQAFPSLGLRIDAFFQ